MGPRQRKIRCPVDPFENSEYRLESAVNIPENKDNPELRIETIKRAIAKYGAVTFQYNNASNIYYYNPKNETGSQSYPHACTIIGWDDTIPADRLAPGARHDRITVRIYPLCGSLR